MRKPFRPGTVRCALAGLLLGTAACSVGYSTTILDGAARTARDIPDYFVVDPGITRPDEDAAYGPRCYNPMLDPRDGRRLRLVRAANDRGDYEAPAGSYGLALGELLRLECSTGRVIGIVPGRVKSR